MTCSKALLVTLLLVVANARFISGWPFFNYANFISNNHQQQLNYYDDQSDEEDTSYESSYDSSEESYADDDDDDDEDDDDFDWAQPYPDFHSQVNVYSAPPAQGYKPSVPINGGVTTWSQGSGGVSVTTNDYDGTVILSGPHVYEVFNGMHGSKFSRINGVIYVNSNVLGTNRIYCEKPDEIVLIDDKGECTQKKYNERRLVVSFTLNTQECAKIIEKFNKMSPITGGAFNNYYL